MRGFRRTTIAVSLAATALATGVAAASAPASLTGHGQGTWKVKPNNIPDVGTQEILGGHGHFTIGKARILAEVDAPGFVVEGSCHVSVRLFTDGGSIRLLGHSKVQSRADGSICDGHDFRFHFHTKAATGDLAGKSYQGVGRFDLEGASADHGTFTLKLSNLS
jgi:hypothetical protein